MSALNVVAVLVANESKEDELDAVFRTVIEETLKEEGCIKYAMHRVVDDPRTSVFIEEWADMEALKTHAAAPHMLELQKQKDELVESTQVMPLL
ncbi:MAG: antibiotic biosynthesis monooxygenase [Candidatus Lindowbacteria bacterium]|nr:antibiotic biosynthesis monooxygenase [Candidatus Lindowbacteria bacterium]